MKVRSKGRIISVAVIVAVGVNSDGRREVLGMDIGPSEAETFWTAFLRKLVRRGPGGVKLVVSDAHEGIKAAVVKVLCASWQRCRVHTIRTQSTTGLIGRSMPARWRAVQRNDMADLQAAFMNDDALDDELQDGLLVGEARRVEAAAEGGQVVQRHPGLGLLAAQRLLLGDTDVRARRAARPASGVAR